MIRDMTWRMNGATGNNGFFGTATRVASVRAILSKRGQRQAVTFFEHGAVNRQLARTEEEFEIFTRMDRQRKVKEGPFRMTQLGGIS